MKNFKLLIMLFLLGACGYNQDLQDVQNIQEVYVPENITNENLKLLNKVKDKDNYNYGDYIQLAIIYAESNEPDEVVKYWMSRSMALNSEKTEETINHILEHKKDWNISLNYSYVLRQVIDSEDSANR